MPARETVAGEALRSDSFSKTSLTFSLIGMRSFFAKIKDLVVVHDCNEVHDPDRVDRYVENHT